MQKENTTQTQSRDAVQWQQLAEMKPSRVISYIQLPVSAVNQSKNATNFKLYSSRGQVKKNVYRNWLVDPPVAIRGTALDFTWDDIFISDLIMWASEKALTSQSSDRVKQCEKNEPMSAFCPVHYEKKNVQAMQYFISPTFYLSFLSILLCLTRSEPV